LGGTTELTDRRFFYEPSIVRTIISDTIETTSIDEDGKTVKVVTRQDRPYDAILLSSGDRSTPLNEDTNNMLFMIKDEDIHSQSFSSSIDPANPAPDTITIAKLYDYSNNPFGQTLTTQQRETLEIAVSEKSGWYIDLSQSGEKGTSAALAINGVAYFTTFTPPPPAVVDPDTCKLEIRGGGFLYAVDLALGTTIYNWTTVDDGRVDDGRVKEISEQFLGSPTLIVTPDSSNPDTAATTGNIIVGRQIIPVGFTLKTSRTYLYIKE